MEDIVDRLRVLNFMGPWKEAADEIERLRLANSDLQMHYDYAKTEYDRLREELQNEYYRGFNEGDEAGYKRGYSDGRRNDRN